MPYSIYKLNISKGKILTHIKEEKGFTLAWIVILIAFAGGLIAIVFYAQQLRKNAQVLNITKEMQRYTASTVIFKEKYDAVPGDFRDAEFRLAECNEENYCFGGDGNQVIGNLSENWMQDQQVDNGVMPDLETFLFWKHLLLSGIINDELIEKKGDPSQPKWGATHPKAKNIGGYQIVQSSIIPGESAAGLQIILRSRVKAEPTIGFDTAAVSAYIAKAVDDKIDDGNSVLGRLRASVGEKHCSNKVGLYFELSSSKDCSLAYQVDK